ncbi:MAG: hypothetical protein HN392_00505 [Anaerolineae bacterium]|jgi:hypothetical protein|nr:hypothetical protein [Anaerolineae bacterium]MBT7191934.1 hypothetical protein [Anaerolineae bacterium]MBT7988593.1 hypothetical protein [Anaerolineae bacterium]
MPNSQKNDDKKHISSIKEEILKEYELLFNSQFSQNRNLKKSAYNFLQAFAGVLFAAIVSYSIENLVDSFTQQTFTISITIISILISVASLVAVLINSRKKQAAQEKNAINKIKEKHKDLFAETQNNLTALINGE